MPYNPDFNGAHQRGVGFMQHTIDGVTRRRCNAREAFLAPVLGDPRLTLVTEASATGIVIEKRPRHRRRAIVTAEPRKQRVPPTEVILTSGLLHHAKAPDALRHRPGRASARASASPSRRPAGRRAGTCRTTTKSRSSPRSTSPTAISARTAAWRCSATACNTCCSRPVPVTTTGVEACAFIDPQGTEEDSSIQLYCVPSVYLDRDVSGVEPSHGVTLTPCVLRPKARGSVRLRSADPKDLPVVDCNFFGDPDDLALQMAGVRFAREVLETPRSAT